MRKVFESMGKRKARAGGKSYTYYFTVESSVPLMRSGHAIELSTVFNHPEDTLVTGRQFDETPATRRFLRTSHPTAKRMSGRFMTSRTRK